CESEDRSRPRGRSAHRPLAGALRESFSASRDEAADARAGRGGQKTHGIARPFIDAVLAAIDLDAVANANDRIWGDSDVASPHCVALELDAVRGNTQDSMKYEMAVRQAREHDVILPKSTPPDRLDARGRRLWNRRLHARAARSNPHREPAAECFL